MSFNVAEIDNEIIAITPADENFRRVTLENGVLLEEIIEEARFRG